MDIKDIKSEFTKVGKNEDIYDLISNIAFGNDLSIGLQKELIILALFYNDKYKQTKIKMYFEFAYYLILKYATITRKYGILYDFSINNGFYPIAKYLTNYNFINKNLEILMIEQKLEKYQINNITRTKSQDDMIKELSKSTNNYNSFVAPTSFGKSSMVYDDILGNQEIYDKIGIIVPKKSLLWQNYNDLKKIGNLNYKIIIHDNDYKGDKRFIGVLTQERALRLLNNNDIFFDKLYIDEAHNIFVNDERNVLLARLIRVNKEKNPNQRVLFLSPLINNSECLSIDGVNVSDFKIDFNIKDYDFYYLDKKLTKNYYNRYLNLIVPLNEKYENKYKYIIDNSKNKNMIYVNKPKTIEIEAIQFAKKLPFINNDEIKRIQDTLSKNLSPDFYNVSLLNKGIVYIHGKLPDNIKEYLLYQFKHIDSIKYIFANSVVFEGVNMNIETIFILKTYGLDTMDMFNLIGRVNRLNNIFNNNFDPNKLIVPVHFIVDDDDDSTVLTKLKKLRDSNFKNITTNPLLDSTKEPDYKVKKIEDEYISLINDDNNIKRILISNGINNYYNDFELAFKIIENNILFLQIRNSDVHLKLNELIREIFIKGLSKFIKKTKDNNIESICHSANISYLKNFYHSQFKNKMIYFISRLRNAAYKREKYYVGTSYGKIGNGRNKVYIEPWKENKEYLINISIVLSKMEDDLISFHLEKIINTLGELQLLSEDEINILIYGTNNKNQIDIINFGLSPMLLDFLKIHKLIDLLKKDEKGFFEFNQEIDDIVRKSDNDLLVYEYNSVFSKKN